MIVHASALAHLERTLSPGELLRIEIRAGGCSGFEKHWFTCTQVESDDQVIDGVVVVDSVSAQMLEDAEFRYTQDLQGSRFELAIPQVKSQCGCGMSFDFGS